jgi:Zn-dependent protease with chaperone function
MSDNPKGVWAWALKPGAEQRLLVAVAVICVVLAIANLLVPAAGVPFIADLPLGAAIPAFAAALVAVVLTWPLRMLLRRRASYYADKEDAK